MTKQAVTPVNDPAAILALEATKAALIDDRAAKKASVFATIERLGSDAARASATVFDMAIAFQSGIRDGFLTAGEAKAVYDAYATGFKRAVLEFSLEGSGVEVMTEKSIAAQTSILKTFAEPIAVHMGADLYAMVINARRGIASEDKTGSAYSNMAKVNREAAKLAAQHATLEGAAALITVELITSWISKAPVAAKEDTDKLKALVDAALKLAKGDFATDGKFVALVTSMQAYQAEFVAGRAAAAKSTVNTENSGNATKH